MIKSDKTTTRNQRRDKNKQRKKKRQQRARAGDQKQNLKEGGTDESIESGQTNVGGIITWLIT